MDRRTSLREALDIWWEEGADAGVLGQHLLPSEIYELVIHPSDTPEREDRIDHLTRCALCLQELKDIAQSIKEAEAWDLALPRAAASEIEWPKRIPAEGGKYTIVIRRSIADTNRGVITVQVAIQYRDALEGKTVRLSDGRGQILLRGKIINGEISQEITALDAIRPHFLVEPE